jgi:hypothetical protein
MVAARTPGVSFIFPETEILTPSLTLIKILFSVIKSIYDKGTTRPPRPDNERPRHAPEDPTVVV